MPTGKNPTVDSFQSAKDTKKVQVGLEDSSKTVQIATDVPAVMMQLISIT